MELVEVEFQLKKEQWIKLNRFQLLKFLKLTILELDIPCSHHHQCFIMDMVYRDVHTVDRKIGLEAT